MSTHLLATDTPLLEAGNALAELAREVAAESIRASGDVMDGAWATELAEDWDRAVRYAAQGVGESVPYTIGRMAGEQRGTAMRDELIDIATSLVRGLGAAMALAGYLDDLDDLDTLNLRADEIESVDAAHALITAALGSVNRLHTLILEAEGQQSLPVDD
jgi:hypothetical protein